MAAKESGKGGSIVMTMARGLDLLEWLYGPLGLKDRRGQLNTPPGGDLLEVGSGTGASLSSFVEARSITLVEPDRGCVLALERRVEELGIGDKARILNLSLVDAIDSGLLGVASFDQIVFSFSLCSISDPVDSLRRIKPLLKPGGWLYFIEHTAVNNQFLKRLHRRASPRWAQVTGGCRMDSDPLQLLGSAGFDEVISVGFSKPMGWPIFPRGVIGRARSTVG